MIFPMPSAPAAFSNLEAIEIVQTHVMKGLTNNTKLLNSILAEFW